ncbi:MAG: amino acid adenylation domain-containing protein [Lachnospiraceae bacterium]|nr:amino acid adenylation domain-containing protein [Lachnospiraceae bacterium]
MDIRGETENNALRISVNGRIDSSNAGEAESEIAGIRKDSSFEAMIIDLSGLEYISSAGLTVFLKLYREDRKLTLVNVSDEVYETLDITGFTDFIDIERAEGDGVPGDTDPLNDTSWESPFRPAASLFEEQALAHPEKLAVVSTAVSMTYGELNESVNRIANALRYYNVRPNDTVMILLPRNVMSYAANLGVLKAGAAFVTASTEYPDDRISFMYKDAGCRFLITTHKIAFEKLDLILETGRRPLFLENIITSPWPEDPVVRIDESDLAYMIYTSGSSGKPKGVMIEQGNLSNFLDHNPKNRETLYLAQNASVLLAVAPLTFDFSIMEEFIPLTSGLTVALASNAEILDPLLMRDFMLRHKVDAVCATPSYLNTLLSIPKLKDAMANIRIYDLGAEAFPAGLFEKIRKASPEAVIMNGYGPTEATVSCTMKVIEDTENITIGVPNGNVFCYVVDENNEEVKRGDIGELLICGKCVGRGYKNLPEETAESFIEFRGMRGYRSGDLARITGDNEIEYHGRKDDQVKYHGLRIEPGEIEANMAKCPGIDACSAVVYEGRFLCLYYVPGRIFKAEGQKSLPAEAAGPDELRAFAGEHLAPYMIPDLFVEIPEMPMTANMKVDREALPRPVIPERTVKEPETEMQGRILQIIKNAIPEEEIGTETDLRDTGLSSLDYMVILAELSDTYRVGLNLMELGENATVSGLEKLILSKSETESAGHDKDRYRAAPVQASLYLDMLRTNTVENRLPVLLITDNSVNIEKLKAAVWTAFLKHPILASQFKVEEDGVYMIMGDPERIDREIPLIKKTEAEMVVIRASLATELFDPDRDPLFDIRIYQTEAYTYLYLNFAHAISDGSSVDILIEDIAGAYAGTEPEQEKMTMYQLGEEMAEVSDSILYGQIIGYYKRFFKGMDRWPSVPEDDTGLAPGNDRVARELSLTPAQINDFMRTAKTTGNALFAGLFALTMAKEMKSSETAFVFTHNGRNDSRLTRTVGCVMNYGWFRLRMPPDMTLKDFLRQIRNQVFEEMSIQVHPLMELAGMYPEFTDYFYIFQEETPEVIIEGKPAKTHWLSIAEDCPRESRTGITVDEKEERLTGNKDMFKILTQVYYYKTVMFEMTYLVNRYSRERIERMVENVDRMLSVIVSADPDKLTLSELI